MKALLVIGMVVALTPALGAQDGLRSASLPERPIATPPPGPDDLFRAGPDTYSPRSGRKPPQPLPHEGPPPLLSNGWSYWPYVTSPTEPVVVPREFRPTSGLGLLQLRIAPEARIADGETVTRSQVLDPVASPSAVTPIAPRVARTMYVIPRCYAGDKPPDRSSGCDLTKLRTIR